MRAVDCFISIAGGDALSLFEVDEAANRIRQEVDEEANIIVGATVQPDGINFAVASCSSAD